MGPKHKFSKRFCTIFHSDQLEIYINGCNLNEISYKNKGSMLNIRTFVRFFVQNDRNGLPKSSCYTKNRTNRPASLRVPAGRPTASI